MHIVRKTYKWSIQFWFRWKVVINKIYVPLSRFRNFNLRKIVVDRSSVSFRWRIEGNLDFHYHLNWVSLYLNTWITVYKHLELEIDSLFHFFSFSKLCPSGTVGFAIKLITENVNRFHLENLSYYGDIALRKTRTQTQLRQARRHSKIWYKFATVTSEFFESGFHFRPFSTTIHRSYFPIFNPKLGCC